MVLLMTLRIGFLKLGFIETSPFCSEFKTKTVKTQQSDRMFRSGVLSFGPENQRFPLKACSRSIASKSALKLPLPKDLAPFLWMISKKSVGLSCTGLVKIWSR